METFLLLVLAGFAASFVDGSLGMGFGPTSSTLLLGAGVSPAAVSTTVNLAKVATGAAGAGAHWKAGNVDRRLVARLAGPGVLGTIVGVTVLASVETATLRPLLAIVLLALAVRILVKASRPTSEPTAAPVTARRDHVVSAAAVAGGVTNGMVGSWGPVVTPVVMGRPGITPRVAVGSVNTAEVLVALVASGSILVALGSGGLQVEVLVALMVGGVLAAPVSALLVGRLPSRLLAIGVGVILALTNLRELAGWAGVDGERWVAYGVVVAVGVLVALRPERRGRPSVSVSEAARPRDPSSVPAPDSAGRR